MKFKINSFDFDDIGRAAVDPDIMRGKISMVLTDTDRDHGVLISVGLLLKRNREASFGELESEAMDYAKQALHAALDFIENNDMPSLEAIASESETVE